MIRTKHTEIDLLRRGTVRTVNAEHRPAVGSELRVYAPAVFETIDGERVRSRTRQELHVVIVAVERHNRIWKCAVRAGAVEELRLLRARPARQGSSSGDYTANPALAMPDEPEAPSDQWVKRQAENARRDHAARADEAQRRRELQNLHKRLEVLERSKSRGVDIGPELRVIRSRIDRAQRALDQAKNAA